MKGRCRFFMAPLCFVSAREGKTLISHKVLCLPLSLLLFDLKSVILCSGATVFVRL